MRLSEFVNLTEDGGASSATTCSGSIAPMAMPLGMISRNGGSFFSGTNTTDEFPNTPYKKKKKSKFQNSL